MHSMFNENICDHGETIPGWSLFLASCTKYHGRAWVLRSGVGGDQLRAEKLPRGDTELRTQIFKLCRDRQECSQLQMCDDM